MQSPTPPPNTPKKNSPFRKWLPAIVLALLIHGVLIYFFLDSQKDTTTEAAANTDNTEISAESINVNNEEEVLLTLQEESYSSKKEQVANQDKEDEEKEEKTVAQSIEDKQSEEESAQEKAAINKNSDLVKDITDKNNNIENKGSGSKPNQAGNQNRAPTQQQPLPVDNPSYLPPAQQTNPNDQVLLPRDLPKAEQKVLDQNADYAKTAEQSEDLSDQLSAIVNDVKEQKLRQIEAQQRASKEAYLSNQPAATSPVTQKAAPAKPVTEKKVSTNPTTEKPAELETEQQTATQ